jgi:hypothetical protein
MHCRHNRGVKAGEPRDAHMEVGRCAGDEAREILTASGQRVEVPTDAEEPTLRVEEHCTHIVAHRTLGCEAIEVRGEGLVERIAAVRLVHRDMCDAVHDLEGECCQFHLSDLATG